MRGPLPSTLAAALAVAAWLAVAPAPAAGRAAESLEGLEISAREASADLDLRMRLAAGYEQAGRREEAIAEYRAVIAADSSRGDARRALERLGAIGWSEEDALGRAGELLEEGRTGEAAYLFERYLRDHPDDARARAGLARALGASAPEESAPAVAAAPADAASEPPVDPAEAAATPPIEALAAEAPPTGEASGSPAPEPESGPVELEPAPIARGTEPASLTPPLPSGSDLPGTSLLLAVAGVTAWIVVAVALAVRRARRRRAVTMQGSLERFSLPDVLQMIGLNGKEGTLEVESGAERATLLVGGGKIQQARSGAISGREALTAALALVAGTFRFYEHRLPARIEDRLDLPVQGALLEWAEALDERRRGRSPDETQPSLLAALDDDAFADRLPF